MKIQNYGDWGEDRPGGHNPPACTCFACNEERNARDAILEEDRRATEYDRRVAASSQRQSAGRGGPSSGQLLPSSTVSNGSKGIRWWVLVLLLAAAEGGVLFFYLRGTPINAILATGGAPPNPFVVGPAETPEPTHTPNPTQGLITLTPAHVTAVPATRVPLTPSTTRPSADMPLSRLRSRIRWWSGPHRRRRPRPSRLRNPNQLPLRLQHLNLTRLPLRLHDRRPLPGRLQLHGPRPHRDRLRFHHPL